MCGICGWVHKDGRPIDKQRLLAMNDTLKHRGPNDEGLFIHQHVGLGFRRLSIVDIDGGHQPMANENDMVWLVFNGEIYNQVELRHQLTDRGHRFRSAMDGEVILHLYEEKGIELLGDLRGMFAFALYDCSEDQLYLARDHFGIKPLYYSDQPLEFLFGSEPKSILSCGAFSPRVSTDSLWKFLSFQYVPDPDTMIHGIHKLPPAHYLRLKNGRATLHRYWQARFNPDESKSLSYYIEGITDVLRDSVQVHKHSDVPYGAFLSSGIDSSTITALLQQEKVIDTFTVSFDGAPAHLDESLMARDTAHRLLTNHHEVKVSALQCMQELANIVYHQDDPVADPSSIGLYFLSKLARQHVSVVLSGEGADELFGGYQIYHEPISLQVFEALPSLIRAKLGQIARVLPYGIKGRSFLERGALPLERRFIGNAHIFQDDVKQELVATTFREIQDGGVFGVTDPLYRDTRDLDDITRMQSVDIHTWLPGDILMKADKMSMAHSLELRVPFLDRKVFDFASSIPTQYRISHGTTKYALRQAVSHLLPGTVPMRPKLGFPIPIAQWIRGEMQSFVRDTIGSSAIDAFLNRQYVNQMIDDHCNGKRNYARQIWTILVFALWHQTFIEKSRHCCDRTSFTASWKQMSSQAVTISR